MTDRQQERIEALLDERWFCVNRENNDETQKAIELAYYNGIIKTLEMLGQDWGRDTEGVHTLY